MSSSRPPSSSKFALENFIPIPFVLRYDRLFSHRAIAAEERVFRPPVEAVVVVDAQVRADFGDMKKLRWQGSANPRWKEHSGER